MSRQQKKVACKSCSKYFLVPAVDTGRQEVSSDIIIDDKGDGASFGLICPFCMTHAVYTGKDLE
ncbi:MAG TPA: hypothetical protein VJP79_03690 [Nitrososphaera sp.]|nr:hypothetical protein [Nitrososphaera sp.]